jgi:hypothetical protein
MTLFLLLSPLSLFVYSNAWGDRAGPVSWQTLSAVRFQSIGGPPAPHACGELKFHCNTFWLKVFFLLLLLLKWKYPWEKSNLSINSAEINLSIVLEAGNLRHQ